MTVQGHFHWGPRTEGTWAVDTGRGCEHCGIMGVLEAKHENPLLTLPPSCLLIRI